MCQQIFFPLLKAKLSFAALRRTAILCTGRIPGSPEGVFPVSFRGERLNSLPQGGQSDAALISIFPSWVPCRFRQPSRLDGAAGFRPRAGHAARRGHAGGCRGYRAAQPQSGDGRLQRRLLCREQGDRAAGRGDLRRPAASAARHLLGGLARRQVDHLQAPPRRQVPRRAPLHLGRRGLLRHGDLEALAEFRPDRVQEF